MGVWLILKHQDGAYRNGAYRFGCHLGESTVGRRKRVENLKIRFKSRQTTNSLLNESQFRTVNHERCSLDGSLANELVH